MRTPLLACLLIAAVPACVVGPGEITGVGDDDPMGEGTGEEGGGGGGGEGLGSGSGGGTTATPRVTAQLDKSTMMTENGKTETISVNLTSVDGFAGNVTLNPVLVDGAEQAIQGISVNGPAVVALTANGTGTATYMITIPTNATGAVVNGKLKVNVTSPAGAQDITSAVTINNFLTIDYPTNTGTNAMNHPGRALTVMVKRGTVLKFKNSDTINHTIHGGGVWPHEALGTGTPNTTYDVPTIGVAPGGSGQLGCHDHGTDSYSTYTVQ
jgi:hypothetical protein